MIGSRLLFVLFVDNRSDYEGFKCKIFNELQMFKKILELKFYEGKNFGGFVLLEFLVFKIVFDI